MLKTTFTGPASVDRSSIEPAKKLSTFVKDTPRFHFYVQMKSVFVDAWLHVTDEKKGTEEKLLREATEKEGTEERL